MNPTFAKLLRQKKKRTRDPNLPPPPTLLGQVKELKITKEEIDRVQLELILTKQKLRDLEVKYHNLYNSIETIKSWIKSKR